MLHVACPPGCHRRAPTGYARSALFGGRLLPLADAWQWLSAMNPSDQWHALFRVFLLRLADVPQMTAWRLRSKPRVSTALRVGDIIVQFSSRLDTRRRAC